MKKIFHTVKKSLEPDMVKEEGRYGRNLIGRRYDIKKLNQRLVRIYNALLTGNNKVLEEISRY